MGICHLMACTNPCLLLLLLAGATLCHPISASEFVFNSFNSTSLLLYGNTAIQSSVLYLTTDTYFSIGRALYPHPIPTRPPNSSQLLSFASSFIFSISHCPEHLPGHGFSFLFAPSTGINGTSPAQNLGLFNFTNNDDSSNHLFAVNFNVFQNQEFNNLSDNHVGVNVNSLTSSAMHEAGYWVGNDEDHDYGYDVGFEFRPLRLSNGENYQVWIEYLDPVVNVTMGPAGMKRPIRPLISYPTDILDSLSDEMYVGFYAATGSLVESHRILAWSFSDSNFSIGDALIAKDLSSFKNSNCSVLHSKGFITGILVGFVVFVILSGAIVYLLLLRRKWRRNGKGKQVEDWELEYWPHRMEYQEIYSATKGFSDKNVIGYGGNGKIYKGVSTGGIEVAVKRISMLNEDRKGEFLAEISSLGRLKHRNLVGLRGWCKTEGRGLFLVYDYMANGSLDKWLYNSNTNHVMLNWAQRIRALKDVASGLLYLHEEWEATVLHRDIKTSNVLLDKDMNARLADFGLARVHHHGALASTTQVVGTLGYIAPELVRVEHSSVQTDVFSFGVLVLEVVCGRKPVEQGKIGLGEWAHGLIEKGEWITCLDERLKGSGEVIDELEVEKALRLGLWCTHPEPNVRPSMRVVVKELEWNSSGECHEGEGMDKNLFNDLSASPSWWSGYCENIEDWHPRFEDLQHSLHISSSLAWSTSQIHVDGR